MAWKRGTQNNQAGAIRMGHVKEFLVPSSRERGVTARLRILETEQCEGLAALAGASHAYVCDAAHGLPAEFASALDGGLIYLHAHEHPGTVLAAAPNAAVPAGCIALSEVQRMNCKVCTHENERWTLYDGVGALAHDAREAAIGDTAVRAVEGEAKALACVVYEVRPRFLSAADPSRGAHSGAVVDAPVLCSALARHVDGCIVTLNDLFVVTVPIASRAAADSVPPPPASDPPPPPPPTEPPATIEIVARVIAVEPEVESTPESDEDEDEDESGPGTMAATVAPEALQLPDDYRGLVTSGTAAYVESDIAFPARAFALVRHASRAAAPPPPGVVDVYTSDGEWFPVKRRLLRPCIKLTSIVQAGRGKYREGDAEAAATPVVRDAPPCHVAVDCCTFDRVLLYLEHEARAEPFKFDPTLAPELLAASERLGVRGLEEVCRKVLGSFEERVRRTPIRYAEVVARNKAGALGRDDGSEGRGETLLVLSGMVLDITRWLDEHPGGSSIIPEQALDVDCTAFFEIYHASRQSFLYLREFYIGELAEEDIALLPKPSALASQEATASPAFLEELRRRTPWRLRPEDLIVEKWKSF